MRYLLILLFPVCLQAQSVSVSPYSIQLWGDTPHMGELSVSYKWIGVHYIHAYKAGWNDGYKETKIKMINGEKYTATYNKFSYINSTFALSLVPKWNDYIHVGVILFAKTFPTDNATKINAYIDAGYSFNRFRISYTHISNAWQGDINPGVDFLKISIKLSKP